ncbi:hypothetical protein QVD17_19128 [Tagetes erecta]|uniref:Uncharacterized protein n=1 Tax=Tagetes erecta TaxID=13708 RepID=A0AAD8KJB6_TARER|nr:hypothetical protein QVD17_19128 [Tagetes erecta]
MPRASFVAAHSISQIRDINLKIRSQTAEAWPHRNVQALWLLPARQSRVIQPPSTLSSPTNLSLYLLLLPYTGADLLVGSPTNLSLSIPFPLLSSSLFQSQKQKPKKNIYIYC